ncbi:MAG: nucleotide kinase domain-containing protein [Phycisphaerales bacterium]
MPRRKLPGKLLVIEGPDGVGKTSVCRLLASRLSERGHDVLSLSFPGKQPGSVGELVYRVHHDQGPVRVGEISSLAKQALHVAAHIDAIDRQIVPALQRGQTVLLDRFWWSAWVYGLVGGCHRHRLRALVEAERSAWGNVRPTLAVLLRRPAPIDRGDPLPEWQRLATEYVRLAGKEERLYPVAIVDNVTTPEHAADSIVDTPQLQRLTASGSAQLDIGFREPKVPSTAPTIISHILPLRPTVVYDTYWRFAAERQEIMFRRLEGRPPPWTADPVLTVHKFTNAYRASDRVSQYLIRRVIYRDDLPQTPDEVFFRVMLFKLFNKIETWETLEGALGPLLYETFKVSRYDKVLGRAMSAGASIYSAAYIMPAGGREHGHDRKHQYHLALLDRMISESAPQRLADCGSMQRAFELLKSYPGIGDFLAYQYAIDLNYSELTDFSESDFVVPGPGALDGIRKCFTDFGGLNEPEIIKFMADRQQREFARLGLAFRSLWGRPLQLIDCQNLFCEVDKYARVVHPEVEGLSGRTRIKQRLDPKGPLPAPWYPPKWGLNEAITQWSRAIPLLPEQHLYQTTTKE